MTRHGFFAQIRKYMYLTMVTEKLERLRRSYRDHYHDYHACFVSQLLLFLDHRRTPEGMDMPAKNYVTMEHKTAPKQVPLFEEQDDGNLIPYVKET